MEQLFRVGGTYVMYLVLNQQGLPLLPIHAVWGLVISECAGLLISLTAFLWQTGSNLKSDSKYKFSNMFTKLSLPLYALITMALPLTLNHLLLTLTHSMENLLIPQQLVSFGYTSEEALSHFGILSGMAMSVIMAPTALTGSLSVLLLPRISEAKTTGDTHLISETIKGAAGCGITLGSLCTFLFLFGADWIGAVLFDTPVAGFYIQILSILFLLLIHE
jgi:stage V sporulation protein B